MSDPRNFENWRKLLSKLSWKIARRLHAAGARSVQFEDVFSEACAVWCVARDRFDPTRGVPFAAYLARGVYTQTRRWAESQIQAGLAASLDAEQEDNLPLSERIADDTQIVGLEIERRQILARFASRLPPRARQYLTLLASPPQELCEIARALEARSAYARARGFEPVRHRDADSRLIFDFMGASAAERRTIIGKIDERLAKRDERTARVGN